jgi:hypothetical protein
VLRLVTVKLPFVEIKAPDPKEEKSDVQKLSAVWKDLLKRDQVGTIDEPKRYFHGRCLMRSMAFRETNPPVLWLTGEAGNTILALGGALEHADLSVKAEPTPDASLNLFESAVAATLAETIRSKKVVVLDDVELRSHPPGSEDWSTDVEEILLYGPSENEIDCEFLAEKEKFKPRSPTRSKNILLASPLFVSYRFPD